MSNEAAKPLTFDMSPPAVPLTGPYYPLRFKSGLPDEGYVRRIANAVLDHYVGRKRSRAQWRATKNFRINWKNNVKRDGQSIEVDEQSAQLSFDLFCAHLRGHRRLDVKKLNLQTLNKSWMDASVTGALTFHAPANEDNSHLTIIHSPSFVKGFPIEPAIDREGVAFSNVTLHLQKTLLDLRPKLVHESRGLFDVGTGPWLRDLMAYFNAAVSLIEVTLNMIYYKAKHEASQYGWKFDETTLGPTHGRRLADKIAWIGAITTSHLNNAEREVKSFKRLKEVRNHLHHFDPPVFAYTIEDVAGWLNQLKDIAELVWKIREKINVPLSEHLIEMLLSPEVEAVPKDPSKRRAPQPPSVGYASCRLPSVVAGTSE